MAADRTAQQTELAPHPADRAILLASVAASTIGLGMIAALLAEFQDEFGFADWALGLIAGSSFVTAFIAYVWFSKYADLGHTRIMLMAGAIVGAGSMIWIAQATRLWELVFARALVGVAEGIFVPAARRVAIDWRPDQPGREIGNIFAASVSGFVAGPIIGGLLADAFGHSVPFYVPAAVSLLSLPFLYRLRPRPVEKVEERTGLLELLSNRYIMSGIVIGATEFFSIGALDALWARMMADLGASTAFIGVSFTVILLPIIVMSPIGGRLADRYDPRIVLLIAVGAVIPIVATYGLVAAPVSLAIVGATHAIFNGITGPTAGAAIAIASPPDAIARGQGLYEAVGFLFAAVAAVPAGAVYGSLGRTTLFLAIAVVLAGLLAIGWALGRGHTHTAAA